MKIEEMDVLQREKKVRMRFETPPTELLVTSACICVMLCCVVLCHVVLCHVCSGASCCVLL